MGEETNNTQDKWDYVAERTQRASRWLGSTSWRDVRLTSTGGRTQLRPSNPTILFALWIVAILLCGLFAALTLIIDGPIVVVVIFIGAGLFLLICLHRLPRFIKSITWDSYRPEVKITYGRPFVRQTLSADPRHLEVRLDICDEYVPHTNIRRGSAVLALRRIDVDRPELIIAVTTVKSSANKAYRKLSEFLKTENIDRTLAEVELSNGELIKVPKTALADSLDNKAEQKILNFPDDNLAVYKRDWRIAYIYGIGILLSTILCLASLLLIEEHILVRIPFAMFGAGFCVLCANSFYWFCKTRYTIADKSDDSLSLKASMAGSYKGKLLCKLSDIGAVQICQYGSHFSTYNVTQDVTVYELNAILKKSKAKRINVHRSMSERQLHQDAIAFAEFLGVQLLDHT
jgi:hypothetical protein